MAGPGPPGGRLSGATFARSARPRTGPRRSRARPRSVATAGYAPVPEGRDAGRPDRPLRRDDARPAGKTKTATLAMLKADIGHDAAGVADPPSRCATSSTAASRRRRRRHDRRRPVVSLRGAEVGPARSAPGHPVELRTDARAGLAHRGLRRAARSGSRADRRRAGSASMRIGTATRASASTCRRCAASRWPPACARTKSARIEIDDVDRAARTVVIRDRKDPTGQGRQRPDRPAAPRRLGDRRASPRWRAPRARSSRTAPRAFRRHSPAPAPRSASRICTSTTCGTAATASFFRRAWTSRAWR